MKVGLLSDIHGNADALAAVLEAAKIEGVERFFVAGDFVGYYHQPQRVFELLDTIPFEAIRGNHEDMLQDWQNGIGRETTTAKYGHGIAVAVAELTAERLDWLSALPADREVRVDGRTVHLCHGAPSNTDRYIYPDAEESELDVFFATGADLIVYGHTHYPLLLQRDQQLLVNPGSVGQPRDQQAGAAWAIWDSAAHSVSLLRTTWNQDGVRQLSARHDPKIPYLVNVLDRSISSTES